MRGVAARRQLCISANSPSHHPSLQTVEYSYADSLEAKISRDVKAGGGLVVRGTEHGSSHPATEYETVMKNGQAQRASF